MSEEKALTHLKSMPQEILDRIYGHLFDLEDATVTKVNLKCPWPPREQLTYALFTAILRVDRAIGQGAKLVLYNKNLFVHFRLMDTRGDIETAFRDRSQNFPIIFLPDERSPPPCSVIVDHRRYKAKKAGRPGNLAIVISAFDFPKLCNNLNGDLQHREVETESYTLMALPEAGWPRDQLRSLIWEPLRDLRHAIFQWCVHSKISRFYYKIKVVDGTGSFEPRSKLRAESQHEDCKSDDPEAYNHDDSGYEGDRECRTCSGCGMDDETDDSDWSSEENSNSRVDPASGEDLDSKDDSDSNAESHSEVHNHTSATEILEMCTLRADEEEPYLGDDEAGNGHRRGSLKRRMKR